MKALKPRVEITLDLIDLTPAEASHIYGLTVGLQLKSEWVAGDKAVVIYFTSIHEYEHFLRIMPPAHWS